MRIEGKTQAVPTINALIIKMQSIERSCTAAHIVVPGIRFSASQGYLVAARKMD